MRHPAPIQLERPVEVDFADLVTLDRIELATQGVYRESTARWDLRHRDENGLGVAVVLVGKRLHLHLPTLRRWLAQRAGGRT